MKLVLTDDNGILLEDWMIFEDVDLPDLEELTDVLQEHGFYDTDRTTNDPPIVLDLSLIHI